MAQVHLLRHIALAASRLVLFPALRSNISNPQNDCSSTSLAYEAAWRAHSLLHPSWTSLPSPQLFSRHWQPMVQCLSHLSISHAANPHLGSNACRLRFSTGAVLELSLFKSFLLSEKSPHEYECPTKRLPSPLASVRSGLRHLFIDSPCDVCGWWLGTPVAFFCATFQVRVPL